MTQIGHIVIGLIVVSAAIYLIIFLAQYVTKRKVADLIVRKEKLMTIPMRDRLVKGRQMSLTGQSLRQFEILERKYVTLETEGFAEIDDLGNAVVYESRGLNFVKSAQSLRRLQNTIREAEATIDIVNQGLSDLEQLDIAHKKAVADLEGKYQAVRTQLLSEREQYGPALPELENVLDSLEEDFNEFARLTEEGDHAAAAQVYETLGMETTQLEQRMQQLPALVHTLEEVMPDQLTELHEGYQHMLGTGFKFNIDVDTELSDIEKSRQVGVTALSNLQQRATSEAIDQTAEKIDTLYALFEAEFDASQQVVSDDQQLGEYARHDHKLNHELEIEIDRLSQDFIFTKSEAAQVRGWKSELLNVDTALRAMRKAIKAKDVVYSSLLGPQAAMHADLEKIEEAQVAMLHEFKELPLLLKQERDRLVRLQEKMRQIQRSVERQALAGVPKSYMDQFYVVTDELSRVEKQLQLNRVDLDDIQRQLSVVAADLDTLDEATNDLIEAATVTERLVRKASTFPENETLEQATGMAKHYYESEFDYPKAMQVLADALEPLVPGILKQTINTYRQEQATLKAEFAEKESTRSLN
ncbi:septation ring formation regulator EzrA [Weissella tructae]|uniref:EzrA protein n=2 Tax=Weissella TaxID=46255 RepID=A0A075TYS0_9LACO|nr:MULTISPECIES: septation ring formation regulator EzrA [Weissella]AIG65053.1 EzrA protein [Weissella tructae]AIM62365.1 EzrA protein [Weissella ceti]AIM63703.1 EzrA protein [Weissella ceti]ELA07755.1 septation ring formation regulator EzrA [Weissella ceti NC36]QVV91456.1 septation ring formation regulator EzrA [Weissella tructae]